MKTKTYNKATIRGNSLQIFVRNLFNSTIYALVVAALLLLPFTFSTEDFSIGSTSAFAKDGNNGGGNGGGNKGGNNGGGNKGGTKNHKKGNNKVSSNDSDISHVNGNAYGHNKEANMDGAVESISKSISSLLGRLNAAHASPTARKNASSNSAVGKVATYENTALEYKGLKADLDAMDPNDAEYDETEYEALKEETEAKRKEAIAALEDASNKPVDSTVAEATNELLGIDVDIYEDPETEIAAATEPEK